MTLKTAIPLTLLSCLLLWACDTKTKNVDSCGDGFVDPGEQCDTTTGENSCASLGYYNALGTLTCTSDCQFDDSSCGGRCGDSLVQEGDGETCDGGNLNGQTCQSLGYTGGTLACGAGCTYDVSGCAGRCGNGVIDEGEVCDGAALSGETCQSQGYHGGELVCATDCSGYNVDNCVAVGRCGDGVIQATYQEECDRTQLDGQTCVSQGHYPGTLACDPDTCQFDFAGCAGRCGDGVIQSSYGEACDSSALGGQTCEGLGLHAGTLTCGANCQFVTTGCGGSCGDGVAQTTFGEDCDVVDLAGETCVSQGYHPGTLGCDLATCRFVFTGCGGSCGDGIIQTAFGEVCDTDEFGGADCATEGFYEGTLTCGSNCQRVTTGCSKQCGDGIIQSEYGEDCDGSNLDGQTCESLGYWAPRSGALACLAGCVFDESVCVPISANADLATLTVDAGVLEPVFNPATNVYSAFLSNSISTLTVTATAADTPYATVEISPAQPMTLVVGSNIVTVTVTAESGFVKTYFVGITRDSTLSHQSPNIGTLIYVPAGTFQRDVTATNLSTVSAFRMSQYEITRAQWTAVTGWEDPSWPMFSSDTSDPVSRVSWYDAIAFCNKLSIAEGLTPVYSVSGVNFSTLTYDEIPSTSNATWNAATANWAANGYRLPTEMEWMWAAMGADLSNPGAVNTTGYAKAFAGSTDSNVIDDYAWYIENSAYKTQPAGTKLPNELGFHDLSGNVLEWTWDWHASYPTGTQTDYRGPASGTNRVARGGSWGHAASSCTMASRDEGAPDFRFTGSGFRVVRP